MKELSYIQKHVVLTQRQLTVDGALLYGTTPDRSASVFFQELYRILEISYPRFYKMDMLSKTLFLASEVLLKNSGLTSTEANPHVAIALYNSHSSIDTDKNFQATLESNTFFPSPSLFIYTLPNAALGEIAIRNKFTGENCTFVTPDFDPELCFSHVSNIINREQHTHVICGWFDFMDDCEEANIFLVSKDYTDKIFNIKNLEKK